MSSDKKDLEICADREKISRVLNHLIENAIKFTHEGDHVDVVISDSGDAIRVDVKDNGPGIEAGNIEKIFNRFVQIQQHVGAGEHGTGLGLSIVKQFVEMHAGKIWVESIPGTGTTFSFTLPKDGVRKVSENIIEAIING